jgi:NAD(P)-dependent dehydrogenase (short-subunit alcohol dehydrogenase family)
VDASVAEEVAVELRAAGARAEALAVSIADPEGSERLVAFALEAFGGVDILVNSAGISRQNMIWDMPVGDFDAVVSTHLRGTFLCCRAVANHLIAQQSGCILNISSGVAVSGAVANCSYTAAKAGIVGLTMGLALDLGPLGIRVNAICPAGHSRLFDKPEPWRDRYPTDPRPVMSKEEWPAEHVPPMLVYLASDAGLDVNGQVFAVGGDSIGWFTPMTVAREIRTSDGAFTLDELVDRVPDELLAGVVNPSPRQPDDGRVWRWARAGGLPAAHDPTQRIT